MVAVRRARLWLGGMLVCVVVAALGPAGAASGAEHGVAACNPDGRLFCLEVHTFSGITASDPSRAEDGDRFTYVEWQMRNDGGSTLTHPAVTATLTDYCGSAVCPSQTSAFVPSGGQSVTNTYSNIPAGGNSGAFTRHYFKTADSPATHTVISVTGTVKERANDTNPCGTSDPNCDTFSTTITNSYEPDLNAAYTFVLDGEQFHLATNDERSSFDFTSSSPAPFRADFTTDTSACDVVTSTCFQRILDVAAVGAPSAYNEGPVVFYARLTNLPAGVNANNVLAIHTYDDASVQVIGDQSSERSSKGCTWTFSPQIPVPSICAKKVQGVPQALDVWVWDSGNGRIGFG